MSQYERLQEEQRDAKRTKRATSPKTSTADWWQHNQTKGAKIGAYYKKRARERLYTERYLTYDNPTEAESLARHLHQ